MQLVMQCNAHVLWRAEQNPWRVGVEQALWVMQRGPIKEYVEWLKQFAGMTAHLSLARRSRGEKTQIVGYALLCDHHTFVSNSFAGMTAVVR